MTTKHRPFAEPKQTDLEKETEILEAARSIGDTLADFDVNTRARVLRMAERHCTQVLTIRAEEDEENETETAKENDDEEDSDND